VRRDQKFWRSVIDEVERGGRLEDVAKRHGVRPKTVSWWRWRLQSVGRRAPVLLPVVVSTAKKVQPVGAAKIELRIRDVVIRAVPETDVAYLAALVAALRV